MDERRRREYLRAMGYTVYRPRTALPGARPSPRREPAAPSKGFSGIAELASGAREPEPAAPPPGPGSEGGRGAPRKPDPAPPPASPEGFSGIAELASGARKPDAAAPEPDAEPVWFRARCHSLGARLAVIDLAALGGPSREERGGRDALARSLLENILLALDVDASGLSPEPRVVEWTEDQAKLLPAPSRSGAARDLLEGFVAQWREREGFDNLLAFAGPLSGLLREGGEPGGDCAPDAAGRRLTLTLSLDTMLAEPRRKPEAWAHLQPLRRRLSGESEFLVMDFRNDADDLDGVVIKGTFAKRRLGTLNLPELMAFYNECRADADSMKLLKAYLDRSEESPMTRELALGILGLSESASDKDIRRAHRQQMRKMHPDRGGTNYFAKTINAAKDVLLQ